MAQPDIHHALNELGFSKKETDVYTALLRLQLANAHQIAKAAGVRRTTVYDILEDLTTRGLATKSIQGKRQTYLAEPPQRLIEINQKQQAVLADIMPSLSALPSAGKHPPVVRFYDTVEGIRKAVMDTVNGKEKIRRDFASVEHIVDFLGQRFIDHQIEKRVRRGIRVHSLRCPEPTTGWSRKDWYLRAENPKTLREVRYLPKKVLFEPVVFLHDDTTTIISSKKESYALVIESKELCQALKILFDIAWDSTKGKAT